MNVENSQELETAIITLENTISKQNTEATAAIGQWEVRCIALSEQIQALDEELSNDKMHIIVQGLKFKVTETEEELQRSQAERDAFIENEKSLSSIMEKLEAGKAEVEKCLSLEKESRDEATQKVEVISDERDKALAALELEKQELAKERTKLNTELTARQELENSFNELKALLDKTKGELDQSRADRAELVQKYQSETEELAEKMSSAEDEKARLQEAIYTSEGEINELKMIIGQLEAELQEANDALHSHITDEVTVRATEKAAAALRSQIKDMRDKQVFDYQSLSNEKDARLAAEDEVELLKADLAMLAKAIDGAEGNEEQIKRLTSKAAAEIMYKEREEIESLQKSLEHVMNELKSSRMKEHGAEDRAANSRMHASVCEQELLSTKADVDFLKQSLEESQKCELEMQSLLEHRIKVLEGDRQNLMNVNRADVEAMKADLSNTVIERDQLIHALNESEKANSTLVYSTTVDNDKEILTSVELELTKLRLENAQLLSAASKNASHAERRIRNALGGNPSLVEAEIDSGKQRCEVAEQSLESLKIQYNENAKELKRMKASNDDLISKLKQFEANNVQEDLKRLEADFSRLQLEKITLESKLNETESSSKSNISKLVEKCRVAEAQVRKLGSAEHKEAAVAAEVARLREESSRHVGVNPASSFDDMTFNTERKGPDIDPCDQLDLIRELQSEMNQEREMYHDLLAEHEDLLALLAQQDCEKKCLQQALAAADGMAAVEKAILDAEEKVKQQFGKYVEIIK